MARALLTPGIRGKSYFFRHPIVGPKSYVRFFFTLPFFRRKNPAFDREKFSKSPFDKKKLATLATGQL